MIERFMHSFLFRFLISAVVASVAIIALVGTAVNYFQPPEDDPLLNTLKEVRVINLAENPQLAEAVRKERERTGMVKPEREPPPPPPTIAERQVTGFVHVEYTINPDGSVGDVKVIGAAPKGVYEERARAQVARRMHAPTYNDAGEPVARRTTEIVEFSVPANELLKSK